MSEAGPQANGPANPSGKYIDGIDPEDPEYIKNLQRPAEVKEDLQQMENRSRVKLVLNSQAFKEELEAVVEEQLENGPYPAGLIALQQITDLLLPNAKGTYGGVARTASVIPINDLRGVESFGFAKGEKLLRCKLASLYRVVDLCGWSHGIFNHISARVGSENEHFLVNPFGMMYSEVTASALVKVDVLGDTVDQGSSHFGVSKPSFALHSAIHQARPDIKCVVHLHNPASVAVSAMKCGLLPVSQEAMICGKISYHDYQGVLTEPEERDKLARSLGVHNKVLVVRNNGIVACGETVEEAFHFTFNVMAACESQIKLMPAGLDNIVIPSEEAQEQAFKVASVGGGGVESTGRKWKVGELEFEALMRTLDNSGYRTGYVFKMPMVKHEKKERTNNEVEIPPSSSSFTYVFDDDYEHSKYASPIKAAMERHKKAFKAGWLTTPNAYKKHEVEEIGTTTPKKITKWVPEGDPANRPSGTPIKIENANQFAPQGDNPKELKQKQKSIRKDYYEEKVSAGPQSKILDGISWDEAQRAKDGQLSGAGDQLIVVGAASKGIIQRDHQHNAVVYRQYYAANPFENMSEAEIEAYQDEVQRKERGEPDPVVIEPEPEAEPEPEPVIEKQPQPELRREPEPVRQEIEAAVTKRAGGVNGVSDPHAPASASSGPEGDEALVQLADRVVRAVIHDSLAIVCQGKGQHALTGGDPMHYQLYFFSLLLGNQMLLAYRNQTMLIEQEGNVEEQYSSENDSSEESQEVITEVEDLSIENHSTRGAREKMARDHPTKGLGAKQNSELNYEPRDGQRVGGVSSGITAPEAIGAATAEGRQPEAGASAQASDFVTVQMNPITLYHGQSEAGVMKLKFSIVSSVRRRLTANTSSAPSPADGSSIEEIYAAVSEPLIEHFEADCPKLDQSNSAARSDSLDGTCIQQVYMRKHKSRLKEYKGHGQHNGTKHQGESHGGIQGEILFPQVDPPAESTIEIVRPTTKPPLSHVCNRKFSDSKLHVKREGSILPQVDPPCESAIEIERPILISSSCSHSTSESNEPESLQQNYNSCHSKQEDNQNISTVSREKSAPEHLDFTAVEDPKSSDQCLSGFLKDSQTRIGTFNNQRPSDSNKTKIPSNTRPHLNLPKVNVHTPLILSKLSSSNVKAAFEVNQLEKELSKSHSNLEITNMSSLDGAERIPSADDANPSVDNGEDIPFADDADPGEDNGEDIPFADDPNPSVDNGEDIPFADDADPGEDNGEEFPFADDPNPSVDNGEDIPFADDADPGEDNGEDIPFADYPNPSVDNGEDIPFADDADPGEDNLEDIPFADVENDKVLEGCLPVPKVPKYKKKQSQVSKGPLARKQMPPPPPPPPLGHQPRFKSRRKHGKRLSHLNVPLSPVKEECGDSLDEMEEMAAIYEDADDSFEQLLASAEDSLLISPGNSLSNSEPKLDLDAFIGAAPLAAEDDEDDLDQMLMPVSRPLTESFQAYGKSNLSDPEICSQEIPSNISVATASTDCCQSDQLEEVPSLSGSESSDNSSDFESAESSECKESFFSDGDDADSDEQDSYSEKHKALQVTPTLPEEEVKDAEYAEFSQHSDVIHVDTENVIPAPPALVCEVYEEKDVFNHTVHARLSDTTENVQIRNSNTNQPTNDTTSVNENQGFDPKIGKLGVLDGTGSLTGTTDNKDYSVPITTDREIDHKRSARPLWDKPLQSSSPKLNRANIKEAAGTDKSVSIGKQKMLPIASEKRPAITASSESDLTDKDSSSNEEKHPQTSSVKERSEKEKTEESLRPNPRETEINDIPSYHHIPCNEPEISMEDVKNELRLTPKTYEVPAKGSKETAIDDVYGHKDETDEALKEKNKIHPNVSGHLKKETALDDPPSIPYEAMPAKKETKIDDSSSDEEKHPQTFSVKKSVNPKGSKKEKAESLRPNPRETEINDIPSYHHIPCNEPEISMEDVKNELRLTPKTYEVPAKGSKETAIDDVSGHKDETDEALKEKNKIHPNVSGHLKKETALDDPLSIPFEAMPTKKETTIDDVFEKYEPTILSDTTRICEKNKSKLRVDVQTDTELSVSKESPKLIHLDEYHLRKHNEMMELSSSRSVFKAPPTPPAIVLYPLTNNALPPLPDTTDVPSISDTEGRQRLLREMQQERAQSLRNPNEIVNSRTQTAPSSVETYNVDGSPRTRKRWVPKRNRDRRRPRQSDGSEREEEITSRVSETPISGRSDDRSQLNRSRESQGSSRSGRRENKVQAEKMDKVVDELILVQNIKVQRDIRRNEYEEKSEDSFKSVSREEAAISHKSPLGKDLEPHDDISLRSSDKRKNGEEKVSKYQEEKRYRETQVDESEGGSDFSGRENSKNRSHGKRRNSLESYDDDHWEHEDGRGKEKDRMLEKDQEEDQREKNRDGRRYKDHKHTYSGNRDRWDKYDHENPIGKERRKGRNRRDRVEDDYDDDRYNRKGHYNKGREKRDREYFDDECGDDYRNDNYNRRKRDGDGKREKERKEKFDDKYGDDDYRNDNYNRRKRDSDGKGEKERKEKFDDKYGDDDYRNDNYNRRKRDRDGKGEKERKERKEEAERSYGYKRDDNELEKDGLISKSKEKPLNKTSHKEEKSHPRQGRKQPDTYSNLYPDQQVPAIHITERDESMEGYSKEVDLAMEPNVVAVDRFLNSVKDVDRRGSPRLSRRRGGAIAPSDSSKKKSGQRQKRPRSEPGGNNRSSLDVPSPNAGGQLPSLRVSVLTRSNTSLASSTLSRRSRSESPRVFENSPESLPPKPQIDPLTGEPFHFVHPMMAESMESLRSLERGPISQDHRTENILSRASIPVQGEKPQVQESPLPPENIKQGEANVQRSWKPKSRKDSSRKLKLKENDGNSLNEEPQVKRGINQEYEPKSKADATLKAKTSDTEKPYPVDKSFCQEETSSKMRRKHNRREDLSSDVDPEEAWKSNSVENSSPNMCGTNRDAEPQEPRKTKKDDRTSSRANRYKSEEVSEEPRKIRSRAENKSVRHQKVPKSVPKDDESDDEEIVRNWQPGPSRQSRRGVWKSVEPEPEETKLARLEPPSDRDSKAKDGKHYESYGDPLFPEDPSGFTFGHEDFKPDQEESLPVSPKNKKGFLSRLSCVGSKSKETVKHTEKSKGKSPISRQVDYYDEGEKKKIKKVSKDKDKEEKGLWYFQNDDPSADMPYSDSVAESQTNKFLSRENSPETYPMNSYEKKQDPHDQRYLSTFSDPVSAIEPFLEEKEKLSDQESFTGSLQLWNTGRMTPVIEESSVSSLKSFKKEGSDQNMFLSFGKGEKIDDVDSKPDSRPDSKKKEDSNNNTEYIEPHETYKNSSDSRDENDEERPPIRRWKPRSSKGQRSSSKQKPSESADISDERKKGNDHVSPTSDSHPQSSPAGSKGFGKIEPHLSKQEHWRTERGGDTRKKDEKAPSSSFEKSGVLIVKEDDSKVDLHTFSPAVDDSGLALPSIHVFGPASGDDVSFEPSASFDSADVSFRRKNRASSFDERYARRDENPLFDETNSQGVAMGRKRRVSIASTESSSLKGGRSRSSSTSSNPLNYEPWRAKAKSRSRSMSISEMMIARGTPRTSTHPQRSRSRSFSEIPHAYNSTVANSVARRRSSRTQSPQELSPRMYQPRPRSRSRGSLGDTSLGCGAAPVNQHSISDSPECGQRPFSDTSARPAENDDYLAAAPVRRSESERQPARMAEDPERRNVERSKSDRRQQLIDQNPTSPSKSDTLRSTDSASGGETLEERSSKEGSPTKEHPSPTKEKKKKKKFRIPSFSKKKNKESKESAI